MSGKALRVSEWAVDRLEAATPKDQLSAASIERLSRAAALSLRSLEEPPEPPEWLPRSAPSRLAMDEAIMGPLGATTLSQASGNWPAMGFVGYPFLAELAQIAEYRLLSHKLAQEMTRKWVTFRSKSEEDKTGELKQIEAAFEHFEVKDRFRQMAEWDGLFGRGQLFYDFGVTDDDELKTPLLLDSQKIPKGSLKNILAIEPMFSYPYDYEATDPLSKHFYMPEQWYIMKRPVHHSRLLTFVARPVPNFLKPIYAFGGVSASQIAMQTVEAYISMRGSIGNIIRNYALRGIQTNLSAIMQGGDGELENLINRIKIYTQQASSEGLMVLDKESEAFFQYTAPLTNLPELLEAFRDNICAVASIPRAILFGITPTGMNSSSEGELLIFEQYVDGMQETLFRRPLEKVLRVIQLHLFGKIDEDITFDFNPLRQMNAKQQAEIMLQVAQASNIFTSLGAVDAEELRRKLATDPDSGWNLDLNRTVQPAQPAPPNAINPTGSQENRTPE